MVTVNRTTEEAKDLKVLCKLLIKQFSYLKVINSIKNLGIVKFKVVFLKTVP